MTRFWVVRDDYDHKTVCIVAGAESWAEAIRAAEEGYGDLRQGDFYAIEVPFLTMEREIEEEKKSDIKYGRTT